MKIPKEGSQWFSGVYLGKDTEADEVSLGNANKVRTVKRRLPSQQWNAAGIIILASLPWQPKGDGVDSTVFVMPPNLVRETDGTDHAPTAIEHETPEIADCTQEQVDEAIDCRWVKVWKENELSKVQSGCEWVLLEC